MGESVVPMNVLVRVKRHKRSLREDEEHLVPSVQREKELKQVRK